MPPLRVLAVEVPAGREEKPTEVRVVSVSNQRRGNGNHNIGRGNSDLNHLLSFTLPPRQHPPPRTSRRSARNVPGRQTRERYINAQYRFMLKPTGDYTVHFADPDIYFNWPDVLQVIVPTSSVLPAAAHTIEGPSSTSDSLSPSCPICLSEPVAPRMTKCGHIYCFACILHYLELSDTGQKCRSCPICFDTIHARELKSVKWFDPVSAASESEAILPVKAFEGLQSSVKGKESEYITMRLIQRSTISTLALPKSTTWPSDIIPYHAAPWHFAPDILTFSRFMLATPDYMAAELRKDLLQLDREIDTLRELGSAADDLGVVFVEAAKRKVAEQIEKVGMLRSELVQRNSEATWLELEALQETEGAAVRRRELEEERAMTSAASAMETDDYVPPDAVLHGSHSAYAVPSKLHAKPASRTSVAHPSTARIAKPRRNVNPPAPNDATYLFYQASGGQHVYLHPLDIKILKSHYETYEAFPPLIRIRVEGTEEGSMNDDLRKRCRYLSHLPEACDLTFVEADLSAFLPPASLAPYAQALKKRIAKRKDKAKKDDKARVKSEQAAAQKERQHIYNSPPSRTASARPEDEFSFPGLREVTSREQPTMNLDGIAESLPDQKDEPATSAGQQTVWGTRAIQLGSQPTAQRQAEVDYHDEELDDAWNDFDQMQQRGGRKQGRKKKVVLNLSGGAVSMRR